MVGWHHWFNGHEWTSSGRWWRIGKPGVLQSMGSQRVRHSWATEHSDKSLHWYCHNVEQCGVSSVVVQSLLCLTLWDPRDCTMPGFLVLHYFLEFVQTHVHWVSHAIQSSHPLSPISASAVNLSQHQGLFQWVSSSHQVVTVWSFSFSIRPSNKYSRLISFRIDWLDFLAVWVSAMCYTFLISMCAWVFLLLSHH